jgi:hypothetical protein
MRVVLRLCSVAAAGAVIAPALHAQTCVGFSPFNAAPQNISAQADFASGMTSLGGQWNFGRATGGTFFGVSAIWNSYDAPIDKSAVAFGGTFGAEMYTSTGRWTWCPVGNVKYEVGPQMAIGDRRLLTVAGGVGIGGPLSSGTTTFTLVPFGSASVAYEKPTYANCDGCTTTGETGGLFTGGLGFRFNNGNQITPSLTYTTIDNRDPIFHLTVSFPMGRR